MHSMIFHRVRLLCLFAFPFMILVSIHSQARAAESESNYDGKSFAKFSATGFFHVEIFRGAFWLAAPDGAPFYSIGSNTVHPYGDVAKGLGYSPYNRNAMAKRGSEAGWAQLAKSRLIQWGFNCLGGWSTNHVSLPYFPTVIFVGGKDIPDFFDAAFLDSVDKTAQANARPDDPLLIGYFIGNEMQWAPDWRFGPTVFETYAALPASAPGKKALNDFFIRKYGTVDRMAAAWRPALKSWNDLLTTQTLTPAPGADDAARDDREEFTYEVAHQYYRAVAEAIRKLDPNHIIACNRLMSWTTPAAVALAAGEYCDVVSINHYELGPVSLGYLKTHKPDIPAPGGADASFAKYFQAARRPLLISEFSFRAMDSGLPNSYPPPSMIQPNVPTQAARAKRYEKYVKLWASQPFFVGHHWFEYADEPKEGRFDGENGNFGLVNIEDEPYTTFVDAVTRVNEDIWRIHRDSYVKSLLDDALLLLPDLLNGQMKDQKSETAAASKLSPDSNAELAAAAAGLFVTLINNNADKLVIEKAKSSDNYVAVYYKNGDGKMITDTPQVALKQLWNDIGKIADSNVKLIGAGMPRIAFKAGRISDSNAVSLSRWPGNQ